MKTKIFIITVLTSFSLLILASTGIASQSKSIKIEVKLFHVPPWQSVVKSEASPPAKEGEVRGIAGSQTGGHVTRFFPDGIVLIESDVLESNEEIIKVIKEKVMFYCPDWVKIMLASDIGVSAHLKGGVMGGSISSQIQDQFEIDLESFGIKPLSMNEEETVIRATLSLKDKAGENEKLLDHTFGLKYGKTLIIGFPHNEENKRGTVFWLICRIKDH